MIRKIKKILIKVGFYKNVGKGDVFYLTLVAGLFFYNIELMVLASILFAYKKLLK